ncbi:DUF3465 domain-containing protein [Neisseria sp. Ec49-e6-T10]|uniref:DUF3465 domain-containing protein n=1 Tax=Neisseria sp. Ec49-e6-T10 TaxID=3140744 RepID=UPI003EC14845
MNKYISIIVVAVVLAVGWYASEQFANQRAIEGTTNVPLVVSETTAIERPEHNELLEQAIEQQLHNVPVHGRGIVEKILPDDNHGSRHQRFIIRIESGYTLLVAHNIDLAPKIEALQKGHNIEFAGEYVWNKKGGVIHWTHHDPKGRRQGGWLKYQGQLYQ